ncbi:hypothetical protein [Haloarchaeobius sp. DFWS5]|uniref:hypothetical protein n=1 Tax=Haloarchaeobius sp. DFWS5 TaxID=3446114 RepID=UPI003EBF009E
MQRRRTYLAAVGTAIATAGCFGFGGSNEDDDSGPDGQAEITGTDTTTDSDVQSFGDPLSAGDAEVTLSKPAVQDSYFAQLAQDTIGVMAVDGMRFVFVAVESTGDTAPELDDFSLEAGDYSGRGWTAYESVTPARNPTGDGPYDPESGSGWLGFAVPAPLQEDHVISLSVGGETVRTRLPDSAGKALESPVAEFEITNFSVPESASSGDTVSVSLDVKNSNDTAGVFHGALNAPETKLLNLEFEAGASTTWEGELTAEANDEENNEMDLVLYAVGAREKASVSLGDA